MLATSQGKEYAIEKLKERREENKDKDWSDFTSSMPAGSNMYFGCIACNASIVVPESYQSRPKLCNECQAMKDLGWLE